MGEQAGVFPAVVEVCVSNFIYEMVFESGGSPTAA